MGTRGDTMSDLVLSDYERGYLTAYYDTVVFDATDTDIQYFTAEVSFKYTIYSITDLSGNPL